MQVILLGTGTPNAEPDRSGPAVAVVINEIPYIIDAGPGVVRQVAAAHQFGVRGLEISQLTRVFLTHLHSDHTAGYPDIILTPWVLGRDKPLEVHGPTGTESMTNHLLAAYKQDINERLQGLEPANEEGYKVNVHEISSGTVYQDKNVIVDAFRVKHGSWPAFGFRFTTPDRTFVISGDTAPFNGLVENYLGCDILIHEVYSKAGFKKRPLVWQRYHSNMHTSTYELGEIAARVKPGLLVLYHQLYWDEEEKEILREIQEKYDGKVISGKDLDVY